MTSRLSSVLSTLTHIRRRRSSLRESIHSIASSLAPHKSPSRRSSYQSYSVYSQMMSPVLFRDPEVATKLLDAIMETPGGKRTVSRLARTCRLISEPALNVLWRDLDSLIPIIGLFPSALLKRVRKPGLGLTQAPAEADWEKIWKYGERVRSVTYNENANVSPSIFPMLAQNRPREYMFPNLQQLTWKVESNTALEYCDMFLSPGIKSFQLEVGSARFPSLSRILGDVCSRQLANFSIVSPSSLPDTFTVMLSSQKELRSVSLVAPGALGSGVGRWIASLPELKSLQLDLSSRTLTAVEGFFDEVPSHAGDSTPSSVGTTDSGVFSGEEMDFSDIRKSALQLTGDLETKSGFFALRNLHLTGEVANIAVFLRHFSSPLIQLDIVIEDPPDNAEWMELLYILSDRFGSSLQSLRVSSTAKSRFNDLLRSTSRGEATVDRRLTLEHLQPLPSLRRLEIDLPVSTNFMSEDIHALAHACPNLEELKLCPLARFPVQSGPPKLTLEELAPLTEHCPRLHSLSVPINARRGSPFVLNSPISSSNVRTLHVGHAWVTSDSFHISILLTHLFPLLDNLKYFHDKNRPGYIETNARGWAEVSEMFPHLQNIRRRERESVFVPTSNESTPQPPEPILVETADKGIMAMVSLVHQSILAQPNTNDSAIQVWGPKMVNESVGVNPELVSISIDAAPRTAEMAVEAIIMVSDESVDAVPEIVAEAAPTSVSKSVEAMLREKRSAFHPSSYPMLLPVFNLLSLTCRILFEYPMSIPIRMLHVIFDHMPTIRRPPSTATDSDISMNALQVSKI